MAQEFEKFAARKKYLNEKLAQTHPPIPEWFPGGGVGTRPFGQANRPTWDPGRVYEGAMGGAFAGITAGLTRAGLTAIGKLLSGTASTLKEKLVLDARREKLVEDIAANDPIVSVFEKDEPGGAFKAYATLANVAPTLSLDPQVTVAFLRNAVQTGGALDFQTIKLLADAEYAIKKAKGQVGGRGD